MKITPFAAAVAVGCFLGVGFALSQSRAGAEAPSGVVEYVSIRWDGRDNTHIIRPGGRVEFIGSELRKLPRPDRVNERSFYLNAAMNGLAKEGFEFQGMTPDEIVMRRGRNP